MSEARRRREAVLSLIGEREIRTQAELVAALSELGFSASQASVSRDISVLGLAKSHGRYVRGTRQPAKTDPRLMRVRAGVVGLGRAGDHVLVLRTETGEAPAVGLALDRLALPGIVGTIAGDDTIFVALESATRLREVMRRLDIRQS